MKLTRVGRSGAFEYRIMPGVFFRLIAVSIVVAVGVGPPPGYGAPELAEIVVELTAGSSNIFVPAVALGAGVDGHSQGDSQAIYRPATVLAMRSAGMRPLSYRPRTELAIQSWHWNPRDCWSNGPRRVVLASGGHPVPVRRATAYSGAHRHLSRRDAAGAAMGREPESAPSGLSRAGGNRRRLAAGRLCGSASRWIMGGVAGQQGSAPGDGR